MSAIPHAHLTITRARTFVPAENPGFATIPFAQPQPRPTYRVFDIATGASRPLEGAPARYTTIPAVRLFVGMLAMFLAAAIAGLLLLAILPLALGYRSSAVLSGSMSPAISPGDVVVSKPLTGASIQPGQIIDFDVGDETRIHRVTEVVDGGYRTAGDANSSPDSGIVQPEQIRGVGVMLVPLVGYPQVWVENGRWDLVAVLVLVLVAVFWMARPRWVQDDRIRY